MPIFRLQPYLIGMRQMGIDEPGMAAIELAIVASPNHPMIKGLRGVRKARIARSGMGKRGGGRVIYYVPIGTDAFHMLAAYSKNEQDDLTNEQRKHILAALETIRKVRAGAMAATKKQRPPRPKPPGFRESGARWRGAPRARAAKGSRVGDDLVAAFEEMAAHLRGEIELEAHEVPGGAMTPARIKAIRAKVASSTKEFERLFGIPARTMESYEQGRRNPDGAMRALLRIIDREPAAARRALA